jgi:hypothetical protein
MPGLPRRAQTAVEYLLLLGGVLALLVIAIAILRTGVFFPANEQLAAGGNQFFGLIENITTGFVPPGAAGYLSANPSTLPGSGGTSTITLTYNYHDPPNGNITVNCGNGNYVVATGCANSSSGTQATCTALCTYAAANATYIVSAISGSLVFSPTTVTVGSVGGGGGGANVTPGTCALSIASSNFTLCSASISGIGYITKPASATYRLDDAKIPLQPSGVSTGSTYTLYAGPIYTR